MDEYGNGRLLSINIRLTHLLLTNILLFECSSMLNLSIKSLLHEIENDKVMYNI